MSYLTKEAMAVGLAEAPEEEHVELQLGGPGWSDFGPSRGQVIEAHLTSGDFDLAGEVWAPFLIVQVVLLPEDGGLELECKSLGGVSAEVDAALSSAFNRRKGTIHLCVEDPCPQILTEYCHVTRLRWWKGGMSTFTGGSPSGRRQVEKWLKRDEPAGAEPVPGRGRLRATPKPAPERPLTSDRAGRPPVPGKSKKKASKVDDLEKELPGGKKEELLKKLKDLKARLRGPSVTEADGVADALYTPSSQEDEGSGSAQEGLETGMSLVPSGIKAAKEKVKSRKVHLKKSKEDALEDTRGSSSTRFQSQLVGQALAVSKTFAGEKKKSNSSSSRLGTSLAKILTKGIKRGSSKKKKRKERKKKKKGKKRKRDGDPEGDGDGEESSSSPPSSGMMSDSEKDFGSSDESKSSEDDLEAPLKKKSKKNPGSVLELLVAHAREQLDQSASVEVGGEEKRYLTSGIKMMTYFQVLLKPKISGSPAQMREMHHLAMAIDLLRQGRLGVLGDTLAARFLCLHQSILDGGWAAAKHLEIFPMEEASAASAALMLRTRKHARLAARAQGLDVGYGWGSSGRGHKGKGKQEWQGGDFREQKGKGKKSGKGRGKNEKGYWGNNPHGKGDQEWKENKEAKGDK